ncbi:4Fe-4S binding protein [Peptostreptococcus faecalis]|uniref:4Fe-4S binding protein n=1 Tax=Peptostreptococcus faecalis TaxID=2045015 RepID=UPI000C7CDC62|nr:4Fe-4S binding protein [Peptostreptococcus faecalis]
MLSKIKNFMWIATIIYFTLGFFNIFFAWLGLICFLTPLLISIIKGEKIYCNTYCGRGQLLGLMGERFNLSRKKMPPKWLSNRLFRYAFLIFFMSMFALMIFSTYKVFKGAELKEVITILWTFKFPWRLTDVSNVSPWIAQFSFGFYSIMLTSTVLGFITMVLYRPRSWCVYCPMGTMTQGICELKNRKENF